MIIEFDSVKRDKTLQERGLDFAEAAKIFDGLHFNARDDRFDYGEERFISAGFLENRMVIVVWTERNDARRIISMRYANDRENARYQKYLR
ncbi:BrnT family toxin [Geomonas sp. Red32]|uniref:BrnT family toxin n=1 Tax=Geomonas sp. Red32 TaxID=2912856 RepID=UPI00202CAA48|nr:BrnT family toxin [Geomonas sp. Red32]MCM0081867.1 BrnT family toxin [Geomonas sp. Red32]